MYYVPTQYLFFTIECISNHIFSRTRKSLDFKTFSYYRKSFENFSYLWVVYYEIMTKIYMYCTYYSKSYTNDKMIDISSIGFVF